jgi:hypothetical protein
VAAPLLVVLLVAVIAIGWLAVQRFLPGTAADPAPAPAPASTSASVAAATATPTEAAPATATATPVVQATAEPTPGPQPAVSATEPPLAEVMAPVLSDRVRNGSFEGSFKDHSLASGWTAFDNGSAVFEFLDETWPPAVFDGTHAQRIQVREASQPDRYAGLYQTVNVIPGETYELELYGQIRSGSGDIRVSQYGYRMQLGLDYAGGQDWMRVKEWIELPWDEQPFDAEALFFYDYAMPVVPTGPRLTIFVRAWNKWADPGRVEYTLDAVSLIGPALPEEVAFDEPLPETGEGRLSPGDWVRVLASAAVLGLLLAGGTWQTRRRAGRL